MAHSIIWYVSFESSCVVIVGLIDCCFCQCSDRDDSPGIIAAAIRGEKFNIFDKPFGCGLTVDELLVSGVYIDLQYVRVSGNDIYAIPRMSLFQMYAWAVSRTKSGDVTTFARPLLALLKPPGKFNFDSFEHFHSCTLCVHVHISVFWFV
jgi:hypothetical protein